MSQSILSTDININLSSLIITKPMTVCSHWVPVQLSTWPVTSTYLGWKPEKHSFVRSVSLDSRHGENHPSPRKIMNYLKLEGSNWSRKLLWFHWGRGTRCPNCWRQSKNPPPNDAVLSMESSHDIYVHISRYSCTYLWSPVLDGCWPCKRIHSPFDRFCL